MTLFGKEYVSGATKSLIEKVPTSQYPEVYNHLFLALNTQKVDMIILERVEGRKFQLRSAGYPLKNSSSGELDETTIINEVELDIEPDVIWLKIDESKTKIIGTYLLPSDK